MLEIMKNSKKLSSIPEEQRRFVFFSEGPNYFRTLFPVMSEFMKRRIPFTYLSMDKTDPGLKIVSEIVSSIYIGSGIGFIYIMSTLEAGIVAMTTPGLQSLTIKRSPGVKHYVHIVHSPTGMSSYRKYSFDYFDTVMCSGRHQIEELKRLESIRSLPGKNLLATGCGYMDLLKKK